MSHPFSSELHGILLRVAGWLPDDVLTRARDFLAADRCSDVARLLAFAARRNVLPLDEGDVEALAELLESEDFDPAVLDTMELVPESTPPPWRFSADWGEPDEIDDAEGAMLMSAMAEQDLLSEVIEVPGVRGLWSAVRRPEGDAPYPDPRVVYVVEIDDNADEVSELAELTASFQTVLAEAGEQDPQVEVVSMYGTRPVYQRAAQRSGRLLWSPHEGLEVSVARVFDEVDPDDGPRFAPDHEKIIDEEERASLLNYLEAGTELLVTSGTMADIVDPELGSVVPMDFRTDGSWVWTDTVSYYLRTHHLAPDSDFLEHIRNAGGPPPALDTVLVTRAMEALMPSEENQPVWTTSHS